MLATTPPGNHTSGRTPRAGAGRAVTRSRFYRRVGPDCAGPRATALHKLFPASATTCTPRSARAPLASLALQSTDIYAAIVPRVPCGKPRVVPGVPRTECRGHHAGCAASPHTAVSGGLVVTCVPRPPIWELTEAWRSGAVRNRGQQVARGPAVAARIRPNGQEHPPNVAACTSKTWPQTRATVRLWNSGTLRNRGAATGVERERQGRGATPTRRPQRFGLVSALPCPRDGLRVGESRRAMRAHLHRNENRLALPTPPPGRGATGSGRRRGGRRRSGTPTCRHPA